MPVTLSSSIPVQSATFKVVHTLQHAAILQKGLSTHVKVLLLAELWQRNTLLQCMFNTLRNNQTWSINSSSDTGLAHVI